MRLILWCACVRRRNASARRKAPRRASRLDMGPYHRGVVHHEKNKLRLHAKHGALVRWPSFRTQCRLRRGAFDGSDLRTTARCAVWASGGDEGEGADIQAKSKVGCKCVRRCCVYDDGKMQESLELTVAMCNEHILG